MRILITGGAGYIGSHVAVATLAAGHDIHVLDSYVNASPVALERVREIAGRDFAATEADLRDRAAIEAVVADFRPEATIHLAGLKAVGESVARAARATTTTTSAARSRCSRRWRRGVAAPGLLLERDGLRRPRRTCRSTRTHPRRATNPYGATKLMIETSCATSRPPTRAGRSRCCATSTRSARTPAARSAKTRAACRTT